MLRKGLLQGEGKGKGGGYWADDINKAEKPPPGFDEARKSPQLGVQASHGVS